MLIVINTLHEFFFIYNIKCIFAYIFTKETDIQKHFKNTIMVSNNIPQVKLGIIAVSRDCFPIALSTQRRENIVKEYTGEIFNCQTTVENEQDMLKAVA